MPSKPKYQLVPLEHDTHDSLGMRIALLRKKKGFTQAQLAEKIGIDQKLVSCYERDRLHLNDDMIIRFASVLKVSADELLGLKKQKDMSSQEGISLRFIKRLLVIESFPEPQKKRILRNLDDAIEAFMN